MEVVTNDRCAAFVTKIGLDADAVMSLKRVNKKHASDYLYKSRLTTAKESARALVDWFPQFTSALFWIPGSPWGDGWGEHDQGMRDRREWQTLKALREAHGEQVRLYDKPGHLLEPSEQDIVATLIEVAILAGWDSALVARPNKAVLYCSHNDWVSIQSDTNLTQISSTLSRLGFTRKDFR